jgi:hypothetical protein
MKKQIFIEKYIEPSERIIVSNYIIELWFDKYDYLHSFMGHSAEVWYYSGQVYVQKWYKKDVKHRGRGLPAEIYYESGVVTDKKTFINNH